MCENFNILSLQPDAKRDSLNCREYNLKFNDFNSDQDL